MNPGERVIVGISGGVDSAVSALLLREHGYAVEGLFMKNWDEDDGTEYCTAKADLADAGAVCALLGIPLHTANFAAEYWDNVFEHFLAEYRAGRTPNPDVLCNREIKFKVFLEYAEALGAARIATGHYARMATANGPARLLKGLDAGKDQSYFLHAVPGEQLAKCLFPVGELPKAEVRRIARAHDFPVATKKDSTGICFIGERRFGDFLRRYLPAQPGAMKSVDGEVLGEHHGLMYYTMGQRQGLGIGGRRDHAEEPWYVVDKDLAENALIVAQGSEHPALYHRALGCGQLHWIGPPPAQAPLRLHAKIRYRQADQACTLRGAAGGRWRVEFDQPQRAVTPGQYVVFYDGDCCLGGGVIEERFA
ncbi:MAG: tRNA 2-thiouridine(34) synthase MnmA [Pseudomonadales bacterium]|nr:tRNA 2-thiouridine(34) synthase MnmA [Pseudomonadales bacterium]MBP9033576.1 tRNA 2-thiouridine(34) synthase MnmA [Pseudomonadales bacterium]